MEKIIIIGCGGLAKIVVDMFNQNNEYKIEGIVDTCLSDKSISGIKVIGTDGDLPDILKSGIKKAVVAIGCVSLETNLIRKEKYEKIKKVGFEFINVIQKDTYISGTAQIGKGNIIIGNCYIGPNVTIGSGVIVHPFTSIEHDSVIEDYVQLSQGVKIAGEVKVGQLSFVGMGANIVQSTIVPERTFIKSGSVYY